MTRLLLIDGEAERAQQVARRLRLWGLECSIADCFLYALTTLEWQRPGLILIRAETLDSMTPDEFCSTLKQDPTLRDIPLILVAGPGTKAASVTTHRRFDLVLEDLDHRTLGAHLDKFLRRHEGAAELPYDTVEILSLVDHKPQEVSRREFVQLIEQLSLGLRSGRLRVQADSNSGQVFVVLDHGQVVHAVFGGLEGPPAFRRLLEAFGGARKVSCLFEPEPRWKVGTYPRSIQQAARQRLLNHASEPEVDDRQILKFTLPQP